MHPKGVSNPWAGVRRKRKLHLQNELKHHGSLGKGSEKQSFLLCVTKYESHHRKVYGDEAVSSLHQKALSSIGDPGAETKAVKVNENQIIKLMEMVSHTVRNRSTALSQLISSDGHLNIAKHLDEMSTRPRDDSTSTTPSHTMFNHERPETRVLLFLLSRLADYDFMSAVAWAALHEMCLLIFAWRPRKEPPKAWKLLDHAEDLEDLALYHTRAGMVSVLGGL